MVFIYRTFGVVNPTNKGYSFEWICEDRNDDTTKVSPFKCVTMEGLIKSGKRFPVSFIKHLNNTISFAYLFLVTITFNSCSGNYGIFYKMSKNYTYMKFY